MKDSKGVTQGPFVATYSITFVTFLTWIQGIDGCFNQRYECLFRILMP